MKPMQHNNTTSSYKFGKFGKIPRYVFSTTSITTDGKIYFKQGKKCHISKTR